MLETCSQPHGGHSYSLLPTVACRGRSRPVWTLTSTATIMHDMSALTQNQAIVFIPKICTWNTAATSTAKGEKKRCVWVFEMLQHKISQSLGCLCECRSSHHSNHSINCRLQTFTFIIPAQMKGSMYLWSLCSLCSHTPEKMVCP